MAVENDQFYPNARLTYAGNDVTVFDVNPNTTKVLLDDGEVKEYVTEVLQANAEVYQAPVSPDTSVATDTAPAQPAPAAPAEPAPATTSADTPAPTDTATSDTATAATVTPPAADATVAADPANHQQTA